MSGTVPISDELFDGGPPLRWEKSLGLVRPPERRIARRVVLTISIGWLSLALLATVQVFAFGDNAARSFFLDLATYGRYLIAAPLFILAEADCIERFGRIACHFLTGGFITDQDQPRYDDAITSTRRLLDSATAGIITVMLAYLIVVALILNVPSSSLPAWYLSRDGSLGAFSLAGWWNLLVSMPLLLVLFLGWMWRILLWGRFLWLMALLDLRLVPAHPDGVGGLSFVSTSLRGFRFLALALGTIAAGPVANRVVHSGESPLGFRNVAIGVVVFVVIMAAGPPTVFMRKLRKAKAQGIFAYGALASEVGKQFERKWVNRAGRVEEDALEVPDFSATTDLYSIVANVYHLKDVPFGLKNLTNLIVATLLPFVPIVLLAMPLDEILQSLAKLLL